MCIPSCVEPAECPLIWEKASLPPLGAEALVSPDILCSNRYDVLSEHRESSECDLHLLHEECKGGNPASYSSLSPEGQARLSGAPDLASISQKLDDLRNLMLLVLNKFLGEQAQRVVFNCQRPSGGELLPPKDGAFIVPSVIETCIQADKPPICLASTLSPGSMVVNSVENLPNVPVINGRMYNSGLKDGITCGPGKSLTEEEIRTEKQAAGAPRALGTLQAGAATKNQLREQSLRAGQGSTVGTVSPVRVQPLAEGDSIPSSEEETGGDTQCQWVLRRAQNKKRRLQGVAGIYKPTTPQDGRLPGRLGNVVSSGGCSLGTPQRPSSALPMQMGLPTGGEGGAQIPAMERTKGGYS
ncbi:hypothetical protein NDU88_004773 [Pleurodeles waltl]|uniref:Uncharacterized protein n=1 Tax=Pleurodeles waltl TaxID=8319 RepID=A0AAV7KZC0_PLEWA|nr:hypothetical protein NDU88_004773 [Pleurodeles waltl]